MRTQRQSRNFESSSDSNARFHLLLHQKKEKKEKAVEYESLPKSITILGSTGRPEAVGQKHPQRKAG